jgi:hypothetical protein
MVDVHGRSWLALWEFSLGVYLIVKGFKPLPITADLTAHDKPSVGRDADLLPAG